MTSLKIRLTAALATLTASATAIAHPGHGTPAGISSELHAHLTSSVVVPMEWLYFGLIGVGIAATLSILARRKRARAPK